MSKGLLERVDALEGQLADLADTIRGVCRAVGPDEVLVKVAEIKREKMMVPVTAAVKKGEFKASAKVGPESFVVGVQFKKGGQPIFPGRFQIFVNEMVDGPRSDIVGLAKGATLSLSDGGSIQVTEIYDKVSELDKAIDEAKAYIEKAELPAKPKKTRKKK